MTKRRSKEEKIIIVDDDKDLCNLLCDIIEDEGFMVDGAYDGSSALNKISEQMFDLMIVDNKLSGTDGLSVVKLSKKLNPEIQSIMISAYGNDATRTMAKELGVFEFVDKPFEIKFLIDKVNEALFNGP